MTALVNKSLTRSLGEPRCNYTFNIGLKKTPNKQHLLRRVPGVVSFTPQVADCISGNKMQEKKKAFKKPYRDWFSKSEQHHKWCSFDITVSVQKSGLETRLRFLRNNAPRNKQGLESKLHCWAGLSLRASDRFLTPNFSEQRWLLPTANSALHNAEAGAERASTATFTYTKTFYSFMYSDYQDKY